MIVKILFLNENGTFHVEIVNLEQRMSQGDVKYVRQLPKDKVYRNIFEAEVSIMIVILPCLRFHGRLAVESFLKININGDLKATFFCIIGIYHPTTYI